MMRILLQPFTSFGCHGYTARGLQVFGNLSGRQKGNKGMLDAVLRVAALTKVPYGPLR